MAQFVDLHVHSDKSDGSLTPAQLVRYAKDKGLKGIALTDHDTVDGIDEALREGSRIGVEVICFKACFFFKYVVDKLAKLECCIFFNLIVSTFTT